MADDKRGAGFIGLGSIGKHQAGQDPAGVEIKYP